MSVVEIHVLLVLKGCEVFSSFWREQKRELKSLIKAKYLD